MEFGTAQATHNHGGAGSHRPRRHAGPAAQPDPAARPRGRQHHHLGARLQARATSRTFSSPKPRASARCGTSTSRTRPAQYAVNGTVEDWVTGAVQRGGVRLELLRQHRLRARHPAPARGRPERLVREAGRRRQDGRRRSTPTWRSSTSGTATTTTATATSTSRTATSTTSRPSTRARARRPAAAPQGANAIWSHRSYTNVVRHRCRSARRSTCSAVSGSATRTYWVGDYTVEPENGGVGVFAHEFGHDLGIPDEYDTSGNTGGAENSTGFWTPWSSGSYGSDGTPANGIGNRPFSMSAWDKLVFGWLDYQVVQPGDGKTKITLGPSEAQSNVRQAGRDRDPSRPVRPRRPRHAVRRREVLLLEHRRRHGQH